MIVTQSLLRLAAYVRDQTWLSLCAAVTGASAGMGIALPLLSGEFAPLIITILAAGAIALLVGIVPPEQRMNLIVITGLAVGLRLAAAALLYYGSLAAGRGGFVTGDDASYAGLAWGYLQWLRNDPVAVYLPPLWHGDAYLFGTFVYLESALFSLTGPTPLAMTSINALASAILIVLLYDIARRLWNERAAILAATVTALYPSLILWSALNLKDTLTLLVVVCVFWILAQVQERPRWYLLLGLALLLLPLESLRRYLFIGLAALFPIGVLLIRATPNRRLKWGAASAAISAMLLLLVTSTGGAVGADVANAAGGFAGLEKTRQGMAVGARTAFVDAPALPVHEGDTYVVVDPLATTPPGASVSANNAPAPTTSASPRVVIVTPGTRIVLAPTSPAITSPAPTGPVVIVHPGDIVIVSTSSSATPAPQASRQQLVLRPEAAANTVQFVTGSGDTEKLALTRTLAYIPRGLAYTLFSPFPWEVRRPQDAATIPEMVFWYFALACVPFAVWRAPRRRELAAMVLYVAGLLGLFVLVEGNVGTLYRHRAMVIPFVFVIASPILLQLFGAARERIARLIAIREA